MGKHYSCSSSPVSPINLRCFHELESEEGFDPSTSGFLADSYDYVVSDTRPPRYQLRYSDGSDMRVEFINI